MEYSIHGAFNSLDSEPIVCVDDETNRCNLVSPIPKKKSRKRRLVCATIQGLGNVGFSTPFCKSGGVSTIVTCRGRYRPPSIRSTRDRLAQSIRDGKMRVPRIDGSKRLITRAIVLSMMNSSYRGQPSPIKVLGCSGQSSGTLIRIIHPRRFAYAILSSYREFSDGDLERIRSSQYTDRMIGIIQRRSMGLMLDGVEAKDIQAFQSMLRSSEVCPSCIIDGKKRTRDWFSEGEWTVSQDLLHGIMLDFKKWDVYFKSVDRQPSIDSSPYSGRFVNRLSSVVKECMDINGL